jgi:hypothetical protein
MSDELAELADWPGHECHDCHRFSKLDNDFLIVAADLGEGAFLDVLCPVCWHRRKYRADLKRRLHDMKSPLQKRGLPSGLQGE